MAFATNTVKSTNAIKVSLGAIRLDATIEFKEYLGLTSNVNGFSTYGINRLVTANTVPNITQVSNPVQSYVRNTTTSVTSPSMTVTPTLGYYVITSAYYQGSLLPADFQFTDSFNTSEGVVTLNNSAVVIENSASGICRITTFTFVTSEALGLRSVGRTRSFRETLQAFFKWSKNVAEVVIKVVPYVLQVLANVHSATILPQLTSQPECLVDEQGQLFTIDPIKVQRVLQVSSPDGQAWLERCAIFQ